MQRNQGFTEMLNQESKRAEKKFKAEKIEGTMTPGKRNIKGKETPKGMEGDLNALPLFVRAKSNFPSPWPRLKLTLAAQGLYFNKDGTHCLWAACLQLSGSTIS